MQNENTLANSSVNSLTDFERAVEYIEENITSKPDYEKIAGYAYCSNYHFQRIFSIYSGYTLGEYIRMRKMTLAAAELRSSDIKIIDLALKYGYKNAESFSRAFTKFHGITPSKARKTGVELKSFSRLMSYESIEGGNTVNYFLEEKGGFTLCGFKKRMHGVPYSVERYKQEKEFFRSTKMKQWIINGISSVCSDKFDSDAYYCVLDNFGDGGYEFFYAQPADSGFADNMSERDSASLEKLSITKITVPGGYYAVFKIDCEHYPSKSYLDLYKHIICEWAVSTNFQLANSPEIMICRCGKNDDDNELIEIYIPLEIKSPKS